MTTSAPLRRPRQPRGFTLVELLIVVVILAILAAVVIPQFENTSASAKEAALVSNLQTIRQAISLYRVQHDEVYPGQADWTQFVTQLVTATHADGTSGGGLGPYLRTGIPVDPISASGDGTVVATMPAAPTGATAYIYCSTTGEIRSNSPGAGPSGTDYWDL